MKNIAFLGIGVMGAGMSANLARAGAKVKIWNRTPDRLEIKGAIEAGAIWCDNITNAIEQADVIFTCLGDGNDVKAVMFKVIDQIRSGAVVVDTTTIGVESAQQIGEKLAEYGIDFLDAPVSGGDIGAKQGTLTFMVGGNFASYNSLLPLLQTMGKNIFYCGPIGSGQAVKLCNQILVSHYMTGVCEAMTLAGQLSIDPQLVVQVCGSGAAASWTLSNLGMKVATADFAPGFMIKHMVKDLRLVNEAKGGLNLPVTEIATQLFVKVNNLPGGSEQGTQGMIRAYRE